MSKLICLLFATSVLGTAACAADIPLADRLARFEAIVERERVDQRIPGVALGVIVDGEIVLARGLGLRDIDAKAPVTTNTIFAIGSSTKSFTSVLAAMLEDDGLLDVDDPISKHFPGVVLEDGNTPTIRDALSHCTGLARMPMLSSCVDLEPEEMLEFVARAELAAPYRTGFSYSNINYALAGEAIARAADTTWHDLVRDRIFVPLEMTRSTTTLADRDALDDVSIGYEPFDDDDDSQEPAVHWNLASIAPAGAINASLDDMLRWVTFLLDDGQIGETDELDDGSLADIWKLHVPAGSYATGFFTEERDGVRLVHHGGNVPGFGTQVVLMPDEDAAFVLLTNVMIHPLQSSVIDTAVQCLFGDELPPLEHVVGNYPTDLARYEGRYWFAQNGIHMTAAAQDDKLFLDVPGQTNYELLAPDDEGKWYFALTDTIAVSFAEGEDEAPFMTMFQAGFEFEMPRDDPRGDPSYPTAEELIARAGPPSDSSSALLVGEARFPSQGLVGDYVARIGEGNRVREEVHFERLGSLIIVVDGSAGWNLDLTGHVTEMDGHDGVPNLAGTLGVFQGRWADIYESLEVVEKIDVDGETAYRVLCTHETGITDECVLAEDGRALSTKTSIEIGALGSMSVETVYSDWHEQDGRMYPRSGVSVVMGVGRVETEFTTYKTGITLDESSFAPLEEPTER